MNMLGYMTIKQAKALGFTHHGSYYGIPVYIGDVDGDFLVSAKWWPLDFVMDLASVVEAFILQTFYPEREPSFRFLLGDEL